MEVGQQVKIITYDETIITGTVVIVAPDHIVLDKTNVHYDWIWVDTCNIKESEVV